MYGLKRPQVILDLPTSIPELIVYLTRVNNAMDPNAYFITLVPTTAAFAADIASLAASEALARAGGKGAADARDVKLRTALDDLASRKLIVQTAVNTNPSLAKTIATSAGMNIKVFTPYHKPTIRAALTSAPGVVLVRAKATKRAVYEWQFSADEGKTWVSAGVSDVANVTISGLTLGTTYLFRFRTTVKRVTADFCQPYSLLVH